MKEFKHLTRGVQRFRRSKATRTRRNAAFFYGWSLQGFLGSLKATGNGIEMQTSDFRGGGRKAGHAVGPAQ